DFNNILAVITGNCFLAKLDLDKSEHHLDEIEKASQRAAALCRQMLAYAGKGQLVQAPTNFVELVDDAVKMLRSTLPQNAVIKLNSSPDIPFILGDPAQLNQIAMNLIINAAEAIGEHQGEILLSFAKTEVKAEQLLKDRLGNIIPPGEYVCLEVTDNGCGMDEETKWRIFEPFYTTKFSGRGLGMSAVLGIITAHNGALQLHSELGQGTTFKVFLPAISAEVGSHIETPSAVSWQGSGTILLVEDEEQVRNIARRMLQKLGFTVIEASNGKEALELYQQKFTDISLVLTDMGMPIMDGYALFRELKKLNSELPIIISSGFGDVDITGRIAREDIAGLINKPYTPNQLREVLKRVVEVTPLDVEFCIDVKTNNNDLPKTQLLR
ncbi:MAG: response regulator, partial [Deltaproteobacteria bacterium]